MFFWEFPRRLKYKRRRFGTQCRFHRPGRSGRWNRHWVPKRRLLYFRRRGKFLLCSHRLLCFRHITIWCSIRLSFTKNQYKGFTFLLLLCWYAASRGNPFHWAAERFLSSTLLYVILLNHERLTKSGVLCEDNHHGTHFMFASSFKMTSGMHTAVSSL